MKRVRAEEKSEVAKEAVAERDDAPIVPLITKYRPQTFADVVGQDAAVASLKGAIAKGSSQQFLLKGPPGTGKTTLARIVALEMGCRKEDLIEVDGATHTGIDAMRAVSDILKYKPLMGGMKGLLVDECQALSKAAFQSLLKIVEEPPSWAVMLFCTTEPSKVPAALTSRCLSLDLKPVHVDTLYNLLLDIAEKEGFDAGKDTAGILDLCAAEAEGSPRRAIANFAACAAASDLGVAEGLLRSAASSSEAVELARALWKGASWDTIQPLLARLTDINPESIRHIVRAYVTKIVLSTKDQGDLQHGMSVLNAFSEPFNSFDQITPVVLACGRLLLARAR